MATSPDGPAGPRFGVLGPLLVELPTGPAEIRSGRQRAILGVLLMTPNRVVSMDRLVEELWGPEPPDSAEGAIQTHVSSLRKILEPGRTAGEAARVLVTQPPGYLVRAPRDALDLARFEALVGDARTAGAEGRDDDALARYDEALGLWRGPALADVEAESAPVEAARLEEVRAVVAAERLEALIGAGRHDQAIGELETLATRHPEREKTCGLLMLALYRAGRQQDALDRYRRARAHLRDELGLEPGAALQRLEAAILRQDPALDPAPRAAAAGAVAPPVSPAQPDRVVVVAVVGGDAPDPLLGVAEPLVRAQPGRELVLARLQAAGSEAAAAITERSRELASLAADLERRGVPARAAALTTPDAGEDLVRLAAPPDVDLLLARVGPDGPDAVTLAALAGCTCDVALLAGGRPDLDGGAIAVPVGGAENDWAAIETAAWIARSSGGSLRVVGTRADADGRDASRLLANASLLTQRFLKVTAEPVLAEAGPAGMAQAVADAGLLVVGLSDRWRTEGIGAARLDLAGRVACPVLYVRRGTRPGALAPPGTLTRFAWSVAGG